MAVTSFKRRPGRPKAEWKNEIFRVVDRMFVSEAAFRMCVANPRSGGSTCVRFAEPRLRANASLLRFAFADAPWVLGVSLSLMPKRLGIMGGQRSWHGPDQAYA